MKFLGCCAVRSMSFFWRCINAKSNGFIVDHNACVKLAGFFDYGNAFVARLIVCTQTAVSYVFSIGGKSQIFPTITFSTLVVDLLRGPSAGHIEIGQTVSQEGFAINRNRYVAFSCEVPRYFAVFIPGENAC